MVSRKARRSRGQEPVQGSGSRLESACRLGGRRRDPGASRSFDVGGHVAGSQGLRREDADCGYGVAVQ
jgi:hypothetical protein